MQRFSFMSLTIYRLSIWLNWCYVYTRMALIHFVFMKKGIHKIEMRSKWIGVQWLAWMIVILIIYFKQSWLVRLWSIFLAIKHRFRIIYVFINEYSNCFFDSLRNNQNKTLRNFVWIFNRKDRLTFDFTEVSILLFK